MNSSKLLSVIVLIILLAGCGRQEVFNSFATIPQNGWNKDSLAVFRVDINQTDKPYDLFMQVRNDSRYPNSNLWLFVDVVSPDGHLQRDTLECMLADVTGRWLGAGWGSLYTLKCPYRMHTRFAAQGTYTFRVMHGMRQEDIEGIKNIGLLVRKSQ